jgi:hypothetical protein
MNRDDDEITALAFDYLRGKDEIRARIGCAFENMPRAPLAELIDKFLQTYPKIDTAPLLKQIADTNQGRIEDLNSPMFRSYLVSKCAIDELWLRRAIGSLQKFYEFTLQRIDKTAPMLVAARDDQNSGQDSASFHNIMELLKNRKR